MRTLVVVALPERKEKFPSSFVLFFFPFGFSMFFSWDFPFGDYAAQHFNIPACRVGWGGGGLCFVCFSGPSRSGEVF